MWIISEQLGQRRCCKLDIGQEVIINKESYVISMFGEDFNEQPRLLVKSKEFTIAPKEGCYPNEIELLADDYLKGIDLPFKITS